MSVPRVLSSSDLLQPWLGTTFCPPPHGAPAGQTELQDLLETGQAAADLRREMEHLPFLTLSDRQLCDLELILNGGFAPLKGFLNQNDYERVVKEMRLANGLLWPLPITLDVSKEVSAKYKLGDKIRLEDAERNPLAILTVESIYTPDKEVEAKECYGTLDRLHPAVEYMFTTAGDVNIGGSVRGLQLPPHYDFSDIRITPREMRKQFAKLGWTKVVAFQTRNPMHRSHLQLTLRAARDAKANLLLHPTVGMTKPGDVDHYTRVRCYKAIMEHYPRGMAMLGLNPLAMRMGGPREALLHAIERKNFGCNHFIIGRDHAGPGKDSKGQDFYGPYDAQVMAKKYEQELGIKLLYYNMVVYVEEMGDYLQDTEVPKGMRALNISGTELRRRLFRGLDIPDWFTFPEVVKLLRQTYPPRTQQGFTVFFTGLSGSGKSTIANALRVALMEEGGRPVTLLDGDEVRTHLSTTLTFTKEHRDLNIQRIGFVAAQITRSRGIGITAAIAPYRGARKLAREAVEKEGGFIEIHVSTPIEVCEQRDRKGLYAKARKGILKGFTGIDDPYEAPEKPELTLDTSKFTVKQAVGQILLFLEQEGYLGNRSANAKN
jgi:sulfate adenylyltransferase